jgi:acyl carrier protein
MKRAEVEALVGGCIDLLNESRLPEQKIGNHPQSNIFGEGSPLDSMGLVSLIMDVEDALSDAGYPISLSDAKAMSMKQSPYRTKDALVDFIEAQIVGG